MDYPNDLSQLALVKGQDFKVNPVPHVFYLTKDPIVDKAIIKALYQYQYECALAECKMLKGIIEVLDPPKPKVNVKGLRQRNAKR
jgi:hypothetical protein